MKKVGTQGRDFSSSLATSRRLGARLVRAAVAPLVSCSKLPESLVKLVVDNETGGMILTKLPHSPLRNQFESAP